MGPERCHSPDESGPLVTISRADYLELLGLLELDDTFRTCENCGAWLKDGDEALASTDDYTACWKAASGRDRDERLCRSYRVSEIAAPTPPNTGD